MKKKMPALFIGHGSPMNAVLDNPFTRAMTALGAGGDDEASYPYEGYHHASLSMRAVRFG